MSKNLCIYCNAELEEELFNSTYGCDTGCEYVRIEIECPNCKKVVWDSGTFGYFYDKADKEGYRQEFMEEFAKEMLRLEVESSNNKKKPDLFSPVELKESHPVPVKLKYGVLGSNKETE